MFIPCERFLRIFCWSLPLKIFSILSNFISFDFCTTHSCLLKPSAIPKNRPQVQFLSEALSIPKFLCVSSRDESIKKLTKQRLVEIIKEEYQNILNENRVRMDSMDINFQGRDKAQLLGMKGRLAIDRMDAKAIMYAIQKEFSIRA